MPATPTGGAATCTPRAAAPTSEQIAEPIGVPSTAVYSRRDGIVAWQACVEPETDLHENVEVRCAHLGFGTDPATLWLIADRLAVPAGQPRFSRRPPPLPVADPARLDAVLLELRSSRRAAAHRS